jgi:hypothetical protein
MKEAKGMPLYRSEFPVQASPKAVWHVLMDFDSYPQWNPQIVSITGRQELGAEVKLRLSMPGRPSMDLKARLTAFEPPRLLTWRGHVVAAWLFSGDRIFAVEPLESGGVMLTHSEDIRGLLSPIFALAMGKATRASHHALNSALKQRCEQA